MDMVVINWQRGHNVSHQSEHEGEVGLIGGRELQGGAVCVTRPSAVGHVGLNVHELLQSLRGSKERHTFHSHSLTHSRAKHSHVCFHLLFSTHLILNGAEGDVELKSHGCHQTGRTVAAAHCVGSRFGPAGFLVRSSRGLRRDGRSNSCKALLEDGG